MSYGYLSQMLDQLTSSYAREDIRNDRKGLPLETNIGRLFQTLAWGLEFVHEHAERMRVWDDLDNAKGSVLDRYGANFGVDRGGATDTVYRLLIKVKMIALMSGGDIDTIIWAAASLFDVQPTDIEIQEKFPCKIRIYVDENLLSPERLTSAEVISELMKRIVSAGVGTQIFLRTYHRGKGASYLAAAALESKTLTARVRTATGYKGTVSSFLATTVWEDTIITGKNRR